MSEMTATVDDRMCALTEAIGHFRSALELEPAATEVRSELAAVYRSRAQLRRSGDLEGALDDLLRARELAPGDEAVSCDLADVCAAQARTYRQSAHTEPSVAGPQAPTAPATTVRFDLDPAFLPSVVDVLRLLASSRDPVVAGAVSSGIRMDQNVPTLTLPDAKTLKCVRLDAQRIAHDASAPTRMRVRAVDVGQALETAYFATPEGRVERLRLVTITVTNPTEDESVAGPNVTVKARIESEGRVAVAEVRLWRDGKYNATVSAAVVDGHVSATFEGVSPGVGYSAQVLAENEHGGRGWSGHTVFDVKRPGRR